MSTRARLHSSFTVAAAAVLLACSSGGETPSKSVPATQGDVVVLAWNDLGMHCLNPSYDTLVILPPYNTIWAQVIRRGAKPALLGDLDGVTVEYRLVGNSSSYGKGTYGQFWDLAAGPLFGAPGLPHDAGLDVPYPERFGLAGRMIFRGGDHFEATGVPVVPVDDAGAWNPYQVAELVVKVNGTEVARTQATVPTSDEFSCDKCHTRLGAPADAFANVLARHDANEGTRLAAAKPVLCGGCHATPALGIMTGSARTYVSEAIHGYHGALGPAQLAAVGQTAVLCYDCHPGPRTQCSRSLAHVGAATDGNCTHCHGSLSNVAATIASKVRVPWVNEPSCAAQCHAGIAEVDTGATLYRNARTGHGAVACAACHGSPHTMFPSRVASDNHQPIQYQGAAMPLGDCAVCHGSSRGGDDFGEFPHAGAGAKPNACFVCHTEISADTARWPHRFQWKARTF